MINSTDNKKKKKDLALKSSPVEYGDDDFSDGEAALSRKIKLFFIKRREMVTMPKHQPNC